uniref:Uncharacterized protein n=1 Tax=Cacopsylla melanoneura TaxID=428564 RepID=A0A8D8PQW2_9HEMI
MSRSLGKGLGQHATANRLWRVRRNGIPNTRHVATYGSRHVSSYGSRHVARYGWRIWGIRRTTNGLRRATNGYGRTTNELLPRRLKKTRIKKKKKKTAQCFFVGFIFFQK